MPRTSRLALVATALTSTALAQLTLVVPDNAYATREGNSNFVLPFNATGGGRVQFVHDSSVFTGQGVTTPIRVTALRYRADAINNTWSGGTFPNVTVDMSTCPVDHMAVVATFANNHGPDLTNVFSGPIPVIPGQGGSAPAPWYADIQLATPFVYDPTTGNDLVIDFTLAAGWVGNGGVATGPVDHVGPGATPTARGSRVWTTSSPTAVTGTTTFGYSPVCEFTYAPTVGLWPNFTATPTTGVSPLSVQFTDRSITDTPGGIVLWQWDFDGDSIVDSTLRNPTFVYQNCGSYNVTLTAFDPVHGFVSRTISNLIVTDVVQPDFTFALQPGNVVQFTDTSTPTPTAWSWDFDGDGIADSTLQNPTWAPGPSCRTYQVRLTVSRACGPAASLTKGVAVAPNALSTNLATTLGLFGNGIGNLFDLTVLNPEGINICGLTTCPYTDGTLPLGSSIGCDVYVTDAPGGYNSNHANAAAWRLVASGTGAWAGGNAGSPVPVTMTLNRPVYLPPGTYGMAIHAIGTGLAFRTGVATSANADLSITAGSSKTAPFVAAQTASRSWSGIVHYDTLQTGGSAGFGYFAAGCAGTLGIAGQAFTGLPQIGGTLNVTVTRLPLSATAYLLGFSRTASSFGPLPLDTTSFGMPGCLGRVSPDTVLFANGAANQAPLLFGVPLNPLLVGMRLYGQPLALDPGFNQLGATLGDSWAMLVGL